MSHLLFSPTRLLVMSPDASRDDLLAQDGWMLFLLAGVVAVLVVGAIRLWMKVK
jgi:hypothetical protein